MKRMRVITLVSLLILIFVSVSAYTGEDGKILFTKSEFTREGFEADILGTSGGKRGWWELSQRNICVINPDGTGFKQLTDDDVSHYGRWSPDGQKIAFCSGPSSMVSLYVMDSDGSNKQELLSRIEEIYDFKWSPDGSKILVFLHNKRGASVEAWVVKAGDGTSTQRMGNVEWAKGWNHWAPEGSVILNPNKRLLDGLPEEAEWPEWSPDGIHIAFIHAGRLVIADTTVVGMPEKWRPTKTEPPCNRIGSWSWSPDGLQVLFFAGGNVCSINLDGTDVKNLSMSKTGDACWSSDGTRIAFTSHDGRKKNTEIFIMNADGTDHIQLTNTNYFHSEIDWK